MNKEEIISKTIEEIKKFDGDEEAQHCVSDNAMEELLIVHGYKELVDYIRGTTRYCA